MISAQATAPERIKLGFSGEDWDLLKDRVAYGQRVGELALGHHVERHAGDTYGAFIYQEVVPDGPDAETHFVEWSLPMIQLLRMRLLYAMMEENVQTGRLMHQVPHDHPDNVMYSTLWEAEQILRQSYKETQGEPYPETPVTVINYLDGGY